MVYQTILPGNWRDRLLNDWWYARIPISRRHRATDPVSCETTSPKFTHWYLKSNTLPCQCLSSFCSSKLP
jgi:hypothetical protein